jgi:hypothetical protein
MIVGTKCDQTELAQKYSISAEKFSDLHKLPPPQYFSASQTFFNSDIYAKIVAIATYPYEFHFSTLCFEVKNLKFVFFH